MSTVTGSTTNAPVTGANTSTTDPFTAIPLTTSSNGLDNTASSIESAATSTTAANPPARRPWYACFSCFKSAIDALLKPLSSLWQAISGRVFHRETTLLHGEGSNDRDISNRSSV